MNSALQTSRILQVLLKTPSEPARLSSIRLRLGWSTAIFSITIKDLLDLDFAAKEDKTLRLTGDGEQFLIDHFPKLETLPKGPTTREAILQLLEAKPMSSHDLGDITEVTYSHVIQELSHLLETQQIVRVGGQGTPGHPWVYSLNPEAKPPEPVIPVPHRFLHLLREHPQTQFTKRQIQQCTSVRTEKITCNALKELLDLGYVQRHSPPIGSALLYQVTPQGLTVPLPSSTPLVNA